MTAHQKHRHLGAIMLLLFALCFIQTSFAQFASMETLWQHQLASQTANDGGVYANRIEFDHNGNLITTGYFSSTAILHNNEVIESGSNGNANSPFVIKQDQSGNILWARPFIESGDCYISAISIDDDNNIYLGGNFSGLIEFDLGSGSETYGESFYDYWFVAKLDDQGNLFDFHYGQGMNTGITDLIFYESALYATGVFRTNVDLDPSEALLEAQAIDGSSFQNMFLIKLGTNGELLWAKVDTLGHVSKCEDIHITEGGKIILSGYYVSDFDPDFSEADATLPSAGNHTNFFVATYSIDGNFQHAVYGENLGASEYVNDVKSDGDGNIYVLGNLDASLDIDITSNTQMLGSDLNGTDLFFIKYSPDNQIVWAHTLGGNDEDQGFALNVDGNGNCYVAGFGGGGQFQYDNSGVILGEIGASASILLAKIHSDGSFGEMFSIGETGISAATDMRMFNDGRMVIAAYYDQTLNSELSGFIQIPAPIGEYDSALICFDTGVGIPENALALMKGYPNPVREIFSIQGLPVHENYSVSIHNAVGQTMIQTWNQSAFDTSDWSSGIYFAHIEIGKQTSVIQLVKE